MKFLANFSFEIENANLDSYENCTTSQKSLQYLKFKYTRAILDVVNY